MWILSWVFLWIFSVDFLVPSVPLSEGQKIHRQIHSKIPDKIPATSTDVVKNGVANWEPIGQLQNRKPPKPQNRLEIPPPTSESPLQQRSKEYPENTRKIPPKYEFPIFWVWGGGIWKGISGSLFFVCCGVFWISGLSYSVAGQYVLKSQNPLCRRAARWFQIAAVIASHRCYCGALRNQTGWL